MQTSYLVISKTFSHVMNICCEHGLCEVVHIFYILALPLVCFVTVEDIKCPDLYVGHSLFLKASVLRLC